MYSHIQLAWKYLQYYWGANNGKGHGIHSPFVFELVTQVLNDQREFYAFGPIEQIRQALLHDNRKILVEDHGAGSRIQKTRERKVCDMASSSLKPRKYSQLLFRIVDHYGPEHILELGTSFGITTSYLASANPKATVTTMEGASAVAAMAQENFDVLGLRNIRLVEGNFDDTLPQWIATQERLDLAFIDGNHRYEPTLRYFEQLKPLLHEHSIVVFDDIHWSREMEDAWSQVCEDPAVTLSVDLFFIGVVFFRKDLKVKQQMRIRY